MRSGSRGLVSPAAPPFTFSCSVRAARVTNQRGGASQIEAREADPERRRDRPRSPSPSRRRRRRRALARLRLRLLVSLFCLRGSRTPRIGGSDLRAGGKRCGAPWSAAARALGIGSCFVFLSASDDDARGLATFLTGSVFLDKWTTWELKPKLSVRNG